jgi:putative acetyltransferase
MTRPDLRTRPIEPRDDAAMARVIRSVMTEFGCCGEGFSIHDAEVDHMSRAYAGPGAAYWVVEDSSSTGGGAILGGAGFAQLAGSRSDEKVCELRKMYVLAAGRGLGVGRALLDLCIDGARRAGFKTMYLETFHTMEGARRLYQRSGFVEKSGARGCTGHSGCDRFFQREL